MTDVLDRLAAANPEAASERPPIGDVWRKLAAADAPAAAPRRRGRVTRGLILAVAGLVPVLLVVALVLDGAGSRSEPGRTGSAGGHRASGTTIEASLQQAAAAALAGRLGTVVVIDPRTGAIRALAGGPTTRRPARRYLAENVIDMVIAAAALDTGRATPGTMLAAPASIRIDGVTVRDRLGVDRGRITLREALTTSADTAFAGLAAALGRSTLATYLHRFGLPGAHSSLASLVTGSGLRIIPEQIATVASAAADGGTLALPRIATDDQPRLRRVMSAASARALTAMLREVVRVGTATQAALPGLDVAGTTGTGGGDLWFVGFAPAGAPRLVVAVAVHGRGYGGTVAAPIAAQVLRAGLGTP